MEIAGKQVRGSTDQTGHAATAPSNGDLLMYHASEGQWVPIASGQIPVSVAGVTATTLDAALLEIFSAI